MPAFGVSVTTTFGAVPGPLLVATIVNVTCSPTSTVAGDAVFVTVTFAGAAGTDVSVTSAASRLSDGSPSP